MSSKLHPDRTIATTRNYNSEAQPKSLTFDSKQIPISIGVCSNLPGYSMVAKQNFDLPFVFADSNPLKLAEIVSFFPAQSIIWKKVSRFWKKYLKILNL